MRSCAHSTEATGGKRGCLSPALVPLSRNWPRDLQHPTLYRFNHRLRLSIDYSRFQQAVSLRHYIPATLAVVVFLATGAPVLAQILGPPLPVPDASGGRVPTRRAPAPYPQPGGTRTARGVPAPDLPDYAGPQIHYGKVDKIEEKKLVVVTGDKRFLTFDLFKETEVWREDEEVKREDLKVGDTVRVEADRSERGFFTATRIYIDKPVEPELVEPPAAEEEPTDESTPEDRPTLRTGTDTWDYAKPPPAEHIPVDESDPGPPTLRRKSAEESARIQKERAEAISVPPPQPALPPGADAEDVETFEVTTGPPPPDPLIEKARAQAEAFTASLPNFICRQMVARYHSNEKPANWVAIDLVEAEVAFEDGIESYQSIKVNGKLLKKQEMSELAGGSWSKGEFGTVLSNIFEPWSLTEFKYRKAETLNRIKTKAFWFHVEQSRSNWEAQMAAVSYLPEYRGSVWIDEETARVVRIEMEALNLPVSFPVDTLEMNIDYDMVRIGGQEYLLPVHSENLACLRGDLTCTWNQIDFRNYRRFSAESTLFQTESEVTFEDKEAPPAEPESGPEKK